MISRIQSCNSNVNFQSRIHMDWQTARYFETSSADSITGEFKHQLQKLRNNKERDIVFLKRLSDTAEDSLTLEVVTKDGRVGESVVDNYYKEARQKIDILSMYKEAKESLRKCHDNIGFEALNI